MAVKTKKPNAYEQKIIDLQKALWKAQNDADQAKIDRDNAANAKANELADAALKQLSDSNTMANSATEQAMAAQAAQWAQENQFAQQKADSGWQNDLKTYGINLNAMTNNAWSNATNLHNARGSWAGDYIGGSEERKGLEQTKSQGWQNYQDALKQLANDQATQAAQALGAQQAYQDSKTRQGWNYSNTQAGYEAEKNAREAAIADAIAALNAEKLRQGNELWGMTHYNYTAPVAKPYIDPYGRKWPSYDAYRKYQDQQQARVASATPTTGVKIGGATAYAY